VTWGDICALACAYPRHFCLGYLADRAGLKETGLREAQVTSLSNDDVVLNRNVEQFAAGHQACSDYPFLPAQDDPNVRKVRHRRPIPL
jgi:hypothetical protein